MMPVKLKCDYCSAVLGKRRLAVRQKDGTIKMFGYCCLLPEMKRKPEPKTEEKK